MSLTGLSFKITKLRSSRVLPSYPKQVWDYLKQGLFFTVSLFEDRPVASKIKMNGAAEAIAIEWSVTNIFEITCTCFSPFTLVARTALGLNKKTFYYQ